MYDELVKRLRRYHDNRRAQTVFSEAADAIEELGIAAEVNAKRAMAWAAEAEELKGEKTMNVDLIDRAVRQILNNQLVIMGALDDLIMHGGGNQWAIVHPALTALHDGMASTSAILQQSAEPPKEEETNV